MKNLGKNKLAHLIDKRYELALYLSELIEKDKDFILLNEVEINAVALLYTRNIELQETAKLNEINKKIHKTLLEEGKYYLHQFSIPDSGKIKKGEIVYPLRFMCGNPNTTKRDIRNMINYIRDLGNRLS